MISKISHMQKDNYNVFSLMQDLPVIYLLKGREMSGRKRVIGVSDWGARNDKGELNVCKGQDMHV